MRLLCCFSSPDLTEPLPVARHEQPRPQPTTSSTYIVPENVKNASPLHDESASINDHSNVEIAATERHVSRHKSSMSSHVQESDDELRITGKSTAQWKDEEKEQRERDRERDRESSSRKQASSTTAISSTGEDWRRWKDNPANKDYVILNTLGRGAFADVRPPCPP
jgi:hypothetical protein